MSGSPGPDRIAGGGEMGRRIRELDWSATPIGPWEEWPRSLRTAVGILLHSQYPMFVWWGPELINIYNDAYVPILGARHPDALGVSAPQVWSDIWDVVGPQSDIVLHEGRATWNESSLLVMERYGYAEETYFTFSYSPVPDDSGGVGGLFCACTEETGRVLGERRLRTLRELGERSLAEAVDTERVCDAALAALAANPHDFPFALVYLLSEDASVARLAGAVGIAPEAHGMPAEVAMDGGEDPWGLAAVLADGGARRLDDLEARFGQLPAGAWKDDSTRAALVVPLARGGGADRPAGFLVSGLSPRLAFGADYQSLVELSAGQLATALADVRAYEKERERAASLAELDRAKTLFFSNVSHEFRTPLTLMLGPLEDVLGGGGGLAPEDRERLETSHRNALRLLKLVNTLLDFSRIEAGRLEASFEPVDLAAFTTGLASVFRSAAERAGLGLEVDCPPLGEPVYVDRDMWEKVVFNLLSNAFKFTLRGSVEVSLRRAGGGAELAVRDTGTGIAAEELPYLFERFHRVKHARGRTFEGSGIGLALVRELVALHGGTVSVESEPDRGSTFTVTVPLGRGHLPAEQVVEGRSGIAPSPRAEAYVGEALGWLPGTLAEETNEELSARRSRPDGPVPRILLADDNADMRDYLRRLLAHRYEVEEVADGRSALERARGGSFDLVLTDVMMPGLDGFGLLAELRSDEVTRSLPVVLLSARAGEEARLEGLEAGADDYVVKPFGARELSVRIESLLQLRRERSRTTEALREADRRKDEFLALLAHELRNPLAPIRNAAQVLRLLGSDDPKEVWAREVIDRQSQHLARLVDDLLDVSRITRGKINLTREVVTVEAILRRAVESIRPLVDARKQELVVSLPEEPLRVAGDRVRLVQIVGNLLHNAAKYTDEGGRIALSAEREDGEVAIRVEDDGIGLPEELLEQIFEMFRQGDGSLDRAQGGLGIGLTLVRRLVELHGGRVEATSDGPGLGSEFVVRLPLAEAGADPAEVGGEPVEEAGEGGEETAAGLDALRILVVEDNADSAESLRLLLEMAGHRVRTAPDGAAALEAAERFEPDVVLCDIGLPGMSGYELAERLRPSAGEPAPGRPVSLIALTGYGDDASRERSRRAGFDHHLVKPVEPDALAGLLDAVRAEKGGEPG